jgi:hypothetical protein
MVGGTMFKRFAKALMLGFVMGMAALMPNVECLPVFEKDTIEHVQKNDDNNDDDADDVRVRMPNGR